MRARAFEHRLDPFALGIVLGRGLNGAGDTVGPMVITIASLWGLQVPLAVRLSRAVVPPTDGVWWAISVAFVAQAVTQGIQVSVAGDADKLL